MDVHLLVRRARWNVSTAAARADQERFVEAIITRTANGQSFLGRVLATVPQVENPNEMRDDALPLTNEIAGAVCMLTARDLGLAVHSIPDPTDTSENLARAQTFLAITNGDNVKTRT